jgi:hypothetical protein
MKLSVYLSWQTFGKKFEFILFQAFKLLLGVLFTRSAIVVFVNKKVALSSNFSNERRVENTSRVV